MSMYNDYLHTDFIIEAVHPSGLLMYQSGRGSSSRKFKLPCEEAEEFALRLLGKFYRNQSGHYDPVLPAPFPFFNSSSVGWGRLNLVATTFSIEPLSPCCFVSNEFGSASDAGEILDPTSFDEMERYWSRQEDADNSECNCIVTIGYEENPCDCVTWDPDTQTWSTHAEILSGTCVSSERNPAYEMFTLPNAGLVWLNILDSQGEQVQLKADSYAYKVIPKADIIVHWHNVPVKYLCQIEAHLKSFRGTVNQETWGDSILCYNDITNTASDDRVDCEAYEPETILFIDWQEDRSKRTDCFGGNNQNETEYNMNTTTLKLFFKQKRVEIEFGASGSNASASDDDTGIAGWNHLFNDGDVESTWMRVVVKSTQQPIFPLRAFSDIMYPVL